MVAAKSIPRHKTESQIVKIWICGWGDLQSGDTQRSWPCHVRVSPARDTDTAPGPAGPMWQGAAAASAAAGKDEARLVAPASRPVPRPQGVTAM
jgi:hypothetical protein